MRLAANIMFPFQATKPMVEDHYIHHQNRSFHGELIEFMTSSPLVAMIWEGPHAIQVTRNMLGNYLPQFSVPGTIRGDFSLDILQNIIHGSDSVDTANKEINIWFQESEIIH